MRGQSLCAQTRVGAYLWPAPVSCVGGFVCGTRPAYCVASNRSSSGFQHTQAHMGAWPGYCADGLCADGVRGRSLCSQSHVGFVRAPCAAENTVWLACGTLHGLAFGLAHLCPALVSCATRFVCNHLTNQLSH